MRWRRLLPRLSRAISRGARGGSSSSADRRREEPPPESPADRARRIVRAYHEATKHHFHALARGPGWMDWDNQPDPFRRWAGAETMPLEHVPIGEEPRYGDVLRGGAIPPLPLDRTLVSRLLLDALALSAWKRAGEARWSLRVNPSSGNLHPTEGYVLLPAVEGIASTPVVAHYAPALHALEVRARPGAELWRRLASPLPEGSFVVGLAAIPWREAWKYGERAWRYCCHDAGHALACVRLAAAALGWRATLLDGLGTDEVARCLGLDRPESPAWPEAEEPECLLAVHPAGTRCGEPRLDAGATAELARLPWEGVPNELSREHEDWEAVELAAGAARKPPGDPPREPTPRGAPPPDEPRGESDAASRAGGSPTGPASGPPGSGGSTGSAGPPGPAEPSAPAPWDAPDRRDAADRGNAPAGRDAPGRREAAGTEPVDGDPAGRRARIAESPADSASFRRVVHGRRSAVAMDGRTRTTRAELHGMLARTLPDGPPFDALGGRPRVHLVLFVHRVDDVEPGLWILVRDPADEASLRAALRDELEWSRPEGTPEGLPLFRLHAADVRGLAARVSCHQEIAGDGCFAVAMLARFASPIAEQGAWAYPRLHWEAGAVGQVLYLEAEARGLRSTGIGCFFDDAVHALLGLSGNDWQTLYHFTVGGAVDDPRIQDEPAYGETPPQPPEPASGPSSPPADG